MNQLEALKYFSKIVEESKQNGTYKSERVLTGPQRSHIDTSLAKGVINMCANNYLGLCDHPDIIAAAKESYDHWGYGLSSVRFICGTQRVHKDLEAAISGFLGTEDTILYSSCFDANGGLFETLLGPEDAIISDELNHASIIDGVRLCKARRLRYRNNDMQSLEQCLKEAQDARIRLIATDGVFSMDGIVANLQGICELAEQYNALVMVDDSHAVGFMGENGRGTPEYCGVSDRVDICTGTLGKALGGASGGYTSGRKEIVALLRQRSRPYLFSNTLAPAMAAASLAVIRLLESNSEARDRLFANTRYFREKISALGYDIIDSKHPIVPVMLYDSKKASEMADYLLTEGIYAIGFSYPVVPEGKARIRVQISAAHTKEDLDQALVAFDRARKIFF